MQNIKQNFTKNPVREFKNSRDQVRVISLGGFGDVTQNMFVYEYIPQWRYQQKSNYCRLWCWFSEEDISVLIFKFPILLI